MSYRGVLHCILAGAIIWQWGCTLAPTKTSETRQYDVSQWQKRLAEPLKLNKETVIIDARSTFDFSMMHVLGAVSMQWTDFSEATTPVPGRLKSSSRDLARRLAVYGINPTTPVVVVGYGHAGRGEEGRLAWTLQYLGVRDVQVADVNVFKDKFSIAEGVARPSVASWEPVVSPSLLAERKEVVKAATAKVIEGAKKTFLIDVRSKNEYFSKSSFGGEYSTPEMRAMHIEWREFFSSNGRPNPEMRERLMGVGIGPDDRVIVISQNGVRSGAVTHVLLALGFKNVANYAAGLTELLR